MRRQRSSPLFPYTALFEFAAAPAGAAARAARKEIQRLERALDRLAEREAALHDEMTERATDHGRLAGLRSEEHTSELQSSQYLVCRFLLEKKRTACEHGSP